jgi:hypothetical protein
MTRKKIRFRDGVRFGAGIAIPLSPPKAGEAQPNPKWIHTATEGRYDGYPGGGADITRATLDQIVANFKADPRYKLGTNGLGMGRVLPFDIAHISEMDPRVGDPLANETAMAWALDVKIVDGADGKAQLWTYAELGAKVLAAIQADPPEINYVSIAFTPSAVDPHSGAQIGALMTSVAFTNKPFIRGLTPLAASQMAAQFLGKDQGVLAKWFDPAATPEDAIADIRSALNMPVLVPIAEVLTSVERVIGWAIAGNAPPGVDVDDVMEDFRQILNVPIATPTDQILTQIRTIFQTAQGQESPTMTVPAALLKLFSLFAINSAAENAEQALFAQAEQDHITCAKLADFLKTAGYGSLVDLATKWPELLKAKEKADQADKKVAEMSAELDGYRAQVDTAEVAAVAATYGFPDNAKESLAFHLKHDPKAFRAKYPLPDETRKSLLTTYAAGRQGEVEPGATGAGGGKPVTMASGAKVLAADAIDLRTFSGRNPVEKAISYLSQKEAGFKDLGWNEQVKRAGQFCRDNHSKIVTL